MMNNEYITNLRELLPIPKGYGQGILVILIDHIRSFFKEKRFYIALFYYTIVPIFLVLVQSGQSVVQTGNGIAIYYAQLNTTFYIKSLFLSFFPGQIFLVILSADQIAGEVEQDTYALLNSKPIYHSEILLGKFFGLISILAILEIPALLVIYYFNLIKYRAEWYFAYITSIDEVVAMIILLLFLQGIILGLALVISTIFDRSLYAILTSILGLFILSTASDIITNNFEGDTNYLNLNFYVDAVFPEIFFNLEPIDHSIDLLVFMFGNLITISLLLIIGTLLLRRKEVF